jgi:hypothetical protein
LRLRLKARRVLGAAGLVFERVLHGVLLEFRNPGQSFSVVSASVGGPPLTLAVIGFTPMTMLWRPETPSQQKYAPEARWRAFQRQWVRPALSHGRAA